MMEPNQNIDNMLNTNGMPVESDASRASSAPSITTGASAMASRPSGDVVFNEKPKKNRAVILGMVLLGILAVGGIAFGVWAMMDGNSQVAKKDEQIADLRSQLTEKNDKVVEDSTVVDIETTEDDDVVSASNSKDYIYIGEWALKIKIPENLTITGYKYSMLAGYTSVSITGNTKGGQYLPGFADMSVQSPWLGIISRYPKGTEMSPMSPPAFVFSDEQYDYYCSNPQMVISTDESEIQWEVESVNAIQQMLKNKDNYSKI